MEVLKVTLKQHSPLLHFQPNEPGATLRASEVKPRLDRFIIELLGNGSYEKVKNNVKKDHKDWFINKDGIHALNYSLKIVAKCIDSKIKIPEKKQTQIKENKETHESEAYYFLENFPLILSNMGGNTDKNKLANLSYTQQAIDLIFLFNSKVNEHTINLSTIIKKYIALFFANNNFGQRGDKGFGSFTVSKINNTTVSLPETSECYIKYNIDNKKDQFITLFTVIDYYWKYLKSGINYTIRKVDPSGRFISRERRELYHKSYLYQYLNRNDIRLTWEKRVIKQQLQLASTKLKGDEEERPNKNPFFFARAHLGCPINGILYRKMNGRIIRTSNRWSESYDMINVSISNNKKLSIQRIPAPIIFKPVFDGTKVIINILFDQKVIKGIQAIPDDLMFNFKNKRTNLSTQIPMFIKKDERKYIINYSELIKSFHKSLNYQLPIISAQRKSITTVKLY